MAYFFRSNNAGGGAFFYRTLEVRGSQTITGANIVTDIRSAFFDLPVQPVDGDLVTLPQIFQGSTITLESNGFYTIDPPLPTGAQIPRTFFDISANQAYADYLTIQDALGEVVTIDSVGDIAATYSAIESATGNVIVDSVGDVVASGSGIESSVGTVSIAGTGDLSVSGASAGITSGDVSISSVGELIASGSIQVDPSIAGDVAISGESFLFISGSGGSAAYLPPINRRFVFD